MTTASIEFISDTKQHLKTLEHQLEHIHGVRVDLVEPRDHTHPALISIDIHKGGAQTARAIAQTLFDFLRADESAQGQQHIFLVTIEGERIDIEPLSVEEITVIIVGAEEGE